MRSRGEKSRQDAVSGLWYSTSRLADREHQPDPHAARDGRQPLENLAERRRHSSAQNPHPTHVSISPSARRKRATPAPTKNPKQKKKKTFKLVFLASGNTKNERKLLSFSPASAFFCFMFGLFVSPLFWFFFFCEIAYCPPSPGHHHVSYRLVAVSPLSTLPQSAPVSAA